MKSLSITIAVTIVLVAVLNACGGKSVIHAGVKMADYATAQSREFSQHGITSTDIADLEAGRLFLVIQRYESKAKPSLSVQQNRILCDLYVSVSRIQKGYRCYEELYDRLSSKPGGVPDESYEAIAARVALLYLQTNDHERSAELTKDLSSQGARYLHALALARLGRKAEAEKAAENFAKAYFDPKKSYFAANIFLATNNYKQARDILLNPRTRLSKDYGLMPYRASLGNQVSPASFRLDLFEEYRFGLSDAFSYAPPANAYVEFAVAKSLLETGDEEEANERLRFLLESPLAEPFRELRWMAAYELAKLRGMDGSSQEAIEYLEYSLDLIEEIRSSIGTEAGRIGFTGDKMGVYSKLVQIYADTGRLEGAVETSERAKGRALVDLLSRHEDLLPTVAATGETRALYEKMVLSERDTVVRAAGELGEDVTKLASYSAARKQLMLRAPHFASLVTVLPVNFNNLNNALGENETGVLFQRFGKDLHVFIFDYRGIDHKVLDAEIINAKVNRFRKVIGDFRSDRYESLARDLFRDLFGHTANRSMSKNLVIAPSSALFYLPFGALHDGGQYLAEKHVINIVPSFQLASSIGSGATRERNILIMGNPDRNDPAFDLPGAEKEVHAIERVVRHSKTLLRERATEEALFKEAGKFDVLHIAGHGVFSDEEPLQSKLLLAPTEMEDGDVTVEELYGLRTNAELVVLSACETALGRVSNGDELIGLLRAFLYAGAESVVGSLWEVEDISTAILMRQFYRELEAGHPPMDALNIAQGFVRSRFSHPYFWAGFRYTGRS